MRGIFGAEVSAMEALLNMQSLSRQVFANLVCVQVPFSANSMTLLMSSRCVQTARPQWHIAFTDAACESFPAARGLFQSAPLHKAMSLFAVLVRSRRKSNGAVNDEEGSFLPWHEARLYAVDPAHVSILTHVWDRNELIMATCVPLKPLSGFTYESCEGMRPHSPCVHTAPVMPEGARLAEFATPVMLQQDLLLPLVGQVPRRVVGLSGGQHFLECAHHAISECDVEKQLCVEVILVWEHPCRGGRQTLAVNIVRRTTVEFDRYVDYGMGEIVGNRNGDRFCSTSDMLVDPSGAITWSVSSDDVTLRFMAENSNNVFEHGPFVTSDGVILDYFPGHNGRMDSWLVLRLRLRSHPVKHALDQAVDGESKQRHEIIAAGLEFLFQHGSRNGAAQVPDGLQVFKAMLDRLEWTCPTG